MSAPQPDVLAVELKFTEFDALQDVLQDWKLDFRQLEPGNLSIRVILAGFGEFQLGYIAINRRCEHHSASPQGMLTFTLLAEWTTDANMFAEKLDDRSLLCFPSNDEIVGVSGSDLQMFTISVPELALTKRAVALGYPQISGILDYKGIHLRVEGRLLDHLRACLQIQSANALKAPTVFPCSHANPDQVLDLLIISLASHCPAEDLARPHVRSLALKRALDYAASDTSPSPIRVSELSAYSGVSERTLERAFLEHCGISPKNYLLALQLNGARRDLLAADPASSRVAGIASRWGFWHMSQFAMDYRKLFGELPSTTLKRSSGSHRKD